MKRRSKTSGKAVKAGRRKAATPKRSISRKAVPGRHSSPNRDDTKIARFISERNEALEREKAAAEVLRVISASPGDLQPVFKTILKNATRLCEANLGTLELWENDGVRLAASHGAPRAYLDAREREPLIRPDPHHPVGIIASTKRAVHVPDVLALPNRGGPLARHAGARTLLAVPLLKHNELIGVINIYRQEVRTFTDKQIELVENFAAQAVIAIENARLLNELHQRTDDLSESLEQQTATSEVLKTISSSPGELTPVFDAMLENATRLCRAQFSALQLFKDEAFHTVALFNVPASYTSVMARAVIKPHPGAALGRIVQTKQPVQIEDLRALAAYRDGDPGVKSLSDLAGARTLAVVPMLKESELVGAIAIFRQEVEPFSDKQIELLSNFAAQAVIAIENARLLNELRESLQQQTATADVLKVISRSTFELQTVLNTLVESAARLCDADSAAIYRSAEGGVYRHQATYGYSSEYIDYMQLHPLIPHPGSVLGRVVLEHRAVHVEDVLADPNYQLKEQRSIGGYRTALGVPLMREGSPIGVIVLSRGVVKRFTEKQIELVTTFADQAAIAIENTRLFEAEQQRTRELSESLDQQTATSEVLRVISSSPGELEPVFKAMLENATRICEAKFGILHLYESGGFRIGSTHNLPAALASAIAQRGPLLHPSPLHPLARVVASKQLVHIRDYIDDPAYKGGEPATIKLVELGAAHSVLYVPMLREKELIGVIVIYRQEIRPFIEKQIELVQNFAAQAVIAIENTRLLSELRESLEQQTATANVLRTISTSPGELEPVFNAMLDNATRLCEANFGILYRFDGTGTFQAVALRDAPSAFAEFQQRAPIHATPASGLGRIMSTRQPVHIIDTMAEQRYIDGDPYAVTAVKLSGSRTLIFVPMLKDDELVGAIAIYRREVRPFTEKQIELLTNFAAQAVIAIENTRLLNELRQRTDDLGEALQQQTATAEVLKVIAGTQGELQPVFETMLAKATELCGASYGALWLRVDDGFRYAALHGDLPQIWTDHLLKGEVIRVRPDVPLARLMQTQRPVQILDMRTDPGYLNGDPLPVSGVDIGGIRTLVLVPMMKNNGLVGAIAIYRKEVRPFAEKQIELVQNFAAQAVIAIENARLLSELRESLQQQTATSDVLKIISRSTFDLQIVLDTLTESAARLCEADMAAIVRERGAAHYWATSYGFTPELSDYVKTVPIEPGPGSVVGRILSGGKTVHVSDTLADPNYTFLEVQKKLGYRTMLGVPLLREGMPIGIVLLMRRVVRPFTDKQIELATTFADQAVIAIENVRLFEAEQQRTQELARSLDDLRTAQDRLVQTQKLASLGQLTAGIAHEIKNPLNFVNNFSGVSVELIDELQEAVKHGSFDDKTLAEVAELTGTLRDNLDKIVQHGKRADSIVKNMLLHSREGSGERRLIDVNALVEESLNLAYHGARAEKQGFNVNLERSFDPSAGELDGFPQEITRVLLNLIANGFYAATKRQGQEGANGFEPTIAAATKSLGDRVEIRIRDNGIGIPPEVREKMFNPFFTTKPAGEGTGLGLSISHDIIVKQHAGSIEVDTEPGAFTEFRIILPRTAV